MEIFWLGESSFRLKGKLASVLVGPKGVSVEDILFDGAGEYESRGVMVTGYNGESMIYQITIDKLNVVYLGFSEGSSPNKEKLEQIEATDILLTPRSGVVADLEPKIIMPYAKEENLPKLLKELGAEGVSVSPKLSITKDRLPEEPIVVVLEHAK